MKLSKTDQQMFHKYKKNSKRLVMTGGQENTWFWRTGEIQYAQFTRMSKVDKDSHVNYLLSLSEENRSTNDDYILRFYGPKYVSKNIHYFSLDDNEVVAEQFNPSSTEGETGDVSPIEDIPTVQQLQDMGVQYLLEYLNEYFKNDYPDWETNVRFHPLEKFITNTKNFMLIDELTYQHICAYKNLKK